MSLLTDLLSTEELVLLTRSDKKPKTLCEVDLCKDGVGGRDGSEGGDGGLTEGGGDNAEFGFSLSEEARKCAGKG